MGRYIDAEAFDERVRAAVGFVEEELTNEFKNGVRCALDLLKTQPTADVVEVVRCKDCKYLEVIDTKETYAICHKQPKIFIPFGADIRMNFCSWGERREDDKG